MGGLTVEETARNKLIAQLRLIRVRKQLQLDSNEECFCTSMYQYVPVHTSMYYDSPNFALN
jgi:hypothetical protein